MAGPEGIDQPRHARWVNVSHAVDPIEPGLAVFIQGLGKIDAQLVHGDAALRALPAEQRGEWEESIKLTDRFALSHLWVLGAYEVVRTISERVQDQPALLPKKLRDRVVRTKTLLTRVRIPLAKFIPAKKFPADYSQARHAMHREQGIAWKVADCTFISRRRLSDRLIALLSAIQNHQDRKALRRR